MEKTGLVKIGEYRKKVNLFIYYIINYCNTKIRLLYIRNHNSL